MKEAKPKESQDVLDFKFIFDEIVRFNKFSIEEWKSWLTENPMGAFYQLHTSTRNFTCGRDAWTRFGAIADRLKKRNLDVLRKTDMESLEKTLREKFSKDVLEDQLDFGESDVPKFLSRVVKLVKSRFETLTHHTPCSMFTCDDVSEFEVGPVLFQKHDLFFEVNNRTLADDQEKRIAESLTRSQGGDSRVEEDRRSRAEKRVIEIETIMRERFASHSWVASVKVEASCPEASEEKALHTTRIALNFLKLFLGGTHTYRLATINDFTDSQCSVSLSKNGSERYRISIGSRSRDNHLGAGDWTEAFKDGLKIPYEAAGRVLEYANGFAKIPPLASRFLDSLHWYGDAVSESNLSAKILKYVNALERITGTGKEKLEPMEKCQCARYRPVTDIVAKRSALLYCGQTGDDFESTVTRLKRVYDIRSKLTHGTISPSDQKCARTAEEIAEMTHVILMNGLCYFEYIGLDSAEGTDKHLKKYYDRFEQAVADGFFQRKHKHHSKNRDS